MKQFKKVLTAAIAMLMVLGLATPVFAEGEITHTITIDDTDQNVSHKFEAYQVFAGNLDKEGQGTKLSNIEWGTGVNGPAILTDLKAEDVDDALKATAQIVADKAKKEKFEDEAAATAAGFIKKEGAADDAEDYWIKTIEAGESLFKYCESAQDVAEVISGFASTGKYNADGTVNAADGGVNLTAGQIDAFATIVGKHLTTKAADFTEGTGDNAGKYTAEVEGDGYYFIKDATKDADLVDDETTASDSRSKYLLAIVKDTEVVAKDTGLTPDKKLLGKNEQKVAANSKAIGDTVDFVVTVEVPNTKKYEDHFIFVMNDTLPEGITFTGITSVEINGTALSDLAKEETAPDFDNYDGTKGYYTLKLGETPALPTLTDKKYEWEAEDYDAVAAAGGQKIQLTFNEFKKFVEKNDLIGKTVTIKYTGVVNDDAKYDATANENEVAFQYSNDPNHDYSGDNPGPDDVVGETPKSRTRTYTTSLKIKKVDEEGNPLADAIFELSGTALNRTVITGVRYEEEGYEAKGDETVGTTKYWKLKDGSYTKTDPATLNNTSKYEDTSKTYVQVTYSKVEVAEKETTLTIATDANGVAEFIGLNEGEYTLKETAAPEGFNKLAGESTITISWSDPEAENAEEPGKSQGGFTLTATSFAEATEWNGTDKQFEVTIENKAGTELPSTGGMGTTLFYVVGTLLVLGAGIVLVSKRRVAE